MKITSKKVSETRVVSVKTLTGVEFESAHEAEAVRAAVEMRIKHIRAELEKPLSAGVAATLHTELRLMNNIERDIEAVRDSLAKDA